MPFHDSSILAVDEADEQSVFGTFERGVMHRAVQAIEDRIRFFCDPDVIEMVFGK